MSHRPKLSDDLYDVLDDIKEDNEYRSVDRALRQVLREAGHDV